MQTDRPPRGQAPLTAALTRVRDALRVLAGTPRLLRLVWHAHRGYTVLLVTVNALQGLVPLAQVWVGKNVVDAVAAVFRGAALAPAGGPPPLPPETASQVVRLLVFQAVVTLASQALDPCGRLLQEQLGDHLARDISVRILRKANGLADISLFESPRFYDALQRAQGDASWRPLGVLQQLGGLLRSAINLVSMVGVLLAFRPWLAVAVVVLALPHVVVQFRHQRQNWSLHRYEVPEVRLMTYLRGLLTNKNEAKEVRLFGLGEHFLERYLEVFEDNHLLHQRLRLVQWRGNAALAALSGAGNAGAYAYVVLQALAGRISLGGLTFYAGAVNQVQGALSNIIFQLAALYESNLSVSNLFEFLALPAAMPLPPPGAARRAPAALRQGIEFRNVAFRYPGTERLVLEDVSFAIRPGQVVALVGENGAGKTTLVKLLTRLYDPAGGQVLVDGVDLREYDLEGWRRQIGVVFQDYARFHLTAQENVGVGWLPAGADRAAVEAAAAWSGADAVIARLPDGYDSILGRQFWRMGTLVRTVSVEEGVDLSGGEWQKVALARAFMRTGLSGPVVGERGAAGGRVGRDGRRRVPPGWPDAELDGAAQLLILDEPTASLDAQAEYDVYRRFADLTRGRATLLISHRFSTVRMADWIVVVEHGRVLEQGTHADLVARNGRYAALFEMQAERYR